MMKQFIEDTKKLNLTLIGISLLLLVVGFLVNDPFRWTQVSYKQSPKLISGVEVNDIEKVELLQGTEAKLFLVKENSQWMVGAAEQKYRAENARITKAISDLLEIRRFQKVTSSEKKFVEYEVASEAPEGKAFFHVKAFGKNNKLLFDLYLGKQGSTYNSTLVRLANEKNVYNAKGALRNTWKDDIDFYRDKKILNLVPANVKALQASGRKNLFLKRNDSQNWEVLVRGSYIPGNQDKINNLLKDFLTLQGSKFLDEVPRLPLYARVKIDLLTGNSETLEIKGPGKENNYVVKSGYMPYWMSVPSYRIDNFLLKPEELKAAEKAPKGK